MLLGFLLYYSSTIIFLIPCVSAGDSWDDFANNLATDLAPLITLFGDQITKQFLSESISFLDNFIFCLAPLGVLTAVVSAIRVCGNSSLRAFIGRGQEDPGSAERELLSCVSDSTAEVFSNFGVSRITGKPAILEVVVTKREQVDGSSQLILRTVRQASGLKDAEDPVDHSPNIMLNKGIKRRSRYLFYAAAQFGILLQLGLVVYAALTVFMWPDAFRKDGNRVASYAFPFFVSGTSMLSMGMFSCAWLIEQSSYKRYYKFDQKSSIYWIQPGGQEIGDQVYEAFAGKSDNRLQYIQSVRFSAHSEQSYRRLIQLFVVVCCSMIGFIFQFIGLRGLHSSVILGQLGSTMLMTVVRTALRTERINESDNLLINERALISKYRQELDWFVFHLYGLTAFNLRSEVEQLSEGYSDYPAMGVIETRSRLSELMTSFPAFDYPIKIVASKLAKVIEVTFSRISSRSQSNCREFSFVTPIECKAADGRSYYYNCKVPLYTDKWSCRVNRSALESILGLSVWSLIKTNGDIELGDQCFKVFDLGNSDLPSARRLYCKWVTNESALDQREPWCLLTGCETFGTRFDLSHDIATCHHTKPCGVLAPTGSDIVSLLAQDIFILFLREAVKLINTPDGNISLEDRETSFRARNSLVQELREAFEEERIGSEQDSLICILPELQKRALLPEVTITNPSVRGQVENLIEDGKWDKAFDVVEWIFILSEPNSLQSSMIELGYILFRALMEPDASIKRLATARIAHITAESDNLRRGQLFKVPVSAIHPIQATLWKSFCEQMNWLACTIQRFGNGDVSSPPVTHSMKHVRWEPTCSSTGMTYGINSERASEDTTHETAILRLWFNVLMGREDDIRAQCELCLDWLVRNGHDFLLEWLIVHYIRTCVVWGRNVDELVFMIQHASKKRYCKAISCIARHEATIDELHVVWDIAIEELTQHGDTQAVAALLDGNGPAENQRRQKLALFFAAEYDKVEIASYALRKGVSADERSEKGDTPLTISSYHRSHKVAQLLIDSGADINGISVNHYGMTALMLAVQNQDLFLVKYLLDCGADIHIRNQDGDDALNLAHSGIQAWPEGVNVLTAAATTMRHGC